MILDLIFVGISILIGLIIGIGFSNKFDTRVDQWLRHTIIKQGEPSMERQIIATFLRWGSFIIMTITLFYLGVSIPSSALRPFTLGVVIGMGFTFFFGVGSYISVTITSKTDSVNRSD